MKNHLLLINPWIHDFAAYDFWIKPLGLLYLASYLRQNGYLISYVDCLDPKHPLMQNRGGIKSPKRKGAGQGQFFKEAIGKPYPLAGIPKKYNRYGITPGVFRETLRALGAPSHILVTSMMTYWYPGVWEAIGMLKEQFPAAPVILGGHYATLCQEHAAMSGADVVLTGRIEERWDELMAVLKSDSLYRPDLNAPDDLPYPAFDLLNRPEQLPILTSRGCPYNCTYCASHLLNPVFKRRDPLRVVDEIEHWRNRLNVRNFSFYDDALLADPPGMFIPMAQELIRRRLDVRFHCPNGLHLSRITAETADLMRRSGFETIRFGFETSDRQRQVETGGKVRNEHLAAACRYLHEAGYRPDDIGIYLICGLPGQTAGEVAESIRFVQACGAKPVIAEYSPIPGTALWDESVKASRYDIAGEPLWQNNTLLPCSGPELTYGMYQELKQLAKTMLS
jgi:radical SAM superfamily enzyme YgiQ (UPF0313 family)